MYNTIKVYWRCHGVIFQRYHTEIAPKYFYLSHFRTYIITVFLPRLLRAPKYRGNSQTTRAKLVHPGIKQTKTGALLTDNRSRSQPVKWKHFSRCWPFVREIPRSRVKKSTGTDLGSEYKWGQRLWGLTNWPTCLMKWMLRFNINQIDIEHRMVLIVYVLFKLYKEVGM